MKVLITGGSGDIAKSISEYLKKSGNKYEIYSPSRTELDVTDFSFTEKFISELCPDIVINNAGYIKVNSAREGLFELDKNTLDINLTAVFNINMAAVKANNDVKIINIGSSAGTKARGEWTSYCASKAGLIMATSCWADEGIDVLTLSPGRTISKMRKALFPDEDQSGLMDPDDFALVVGKAIDGKYEVGTNIDVNLNNVKDLISE
ncbi:SDR family oxidoreductase [Vibrio splendidus]|uniref:SDR family oxidoreductase n=1 Tax=Vibrio splendidus TaxID=29497 RepID=UPI00076A5BC9|nr:SDR family oxidoreductase [Vibrio splendidus]